MATYWFTPPAAYWLKPASASPQPALVRVWLQDADEKDLNDLVDRVNADTGRAQDIQDKINNDLCDTIDRIEARTRQRSGVSHQLIGNSPPASSQQ